MGLLDGKAAIVTGSARGIGRATAELFVSEGAKVLINDIDGDVAEQAAGEIDGETAVYAGDLTKEGVPDELVKTAIDAFGAVDIVVNNAGAGRVEPFLASDPAQWRATLDTNLVGALLLVRAALPGMLAAGRGVIVNVGSASASGWPYLTLYAASKAALQAASLSLDRELAPQGVRVLHVEVGPTAGTGFGDHSDPAHIPTARDAWTALGIPWAVDVRLPDESAEIILTAIEQGLAGRV